MASLTYLRALSCFVPSLYITDFVRKLAMQNVRFTFGVNTPLGESRKYPVPQSCTWKLNKTPHQLNHHFVKKQTKKNKTQQQQPIAKTTNCCHGDTDDDLKAESKTLTGPAGRRHHINVSSFLTWNLKVCCFIQLFVLLYIEPEIGGHVVYSKPTDDIFRSNSHITCGPTVFVLVQ